MHILFLFGGFILSLAIESEWVEERALISFIKGKRITLDDYVRSFVGGQTG